MVANASCGDPRRLRGLLEESLPEDELQRMTAHVGSCEACRRALDQLAAGGRWWDELRSFARAETPPGWPTSDVVGGSRCDETALDLDFLEPEDEEGALGRF